MAASTTPPTLKVFKSAVCILIPHHDLLHSVRLKHDKHFKRWPAHINLLYPFRPATNFPDLIPAVTEALGQLKPFKLRLKTCSYFQHSRKSSTVWLRPETDPPDALEQLEQILLGLFPDCDDQYREETGGGEVEGEESGPPRKIFQPHLSLGQFGAEVNAKKECQRLTCMFESDPIEQEVAEVSFIAREGFEDPFTVRATVPFVQETGAGT